jgi:hypothetical protein
MIFAVEIHDIREFVKKHSDACETTGLIWSKLPAISLVNTDAPQKVQPSSFVNGEVTNLGR